MTCDELNNSYFKWMYQLVCNDKYYKNLSYRKLLCFLHHIDFKYTINNDGNRAIDGVDFRYRFAYECGYPRELIRKYLDTRPCSMLEMMISLAFRTEEQIMEDDGLGNRTGEWFWNMIVNLGLGGMCDEKFDRVLVDQVVLIFLNRDYKSNGSGGLFTINSLRQDVRTVEIWCQMMWYLDEHFDFSI